jgi:hypothetical protein
VASEPAAFGHHAKRYIPLEDNEIVVLHVENNALDVTRIQQNRSDASTTTTPEPYLHWTIKGMLMWIEGGVLSFVCLSYCIYSVSIVCRSLLFVVFFFH